MFTVLFGFASDRIRYKLILCNKIVLDELDEHLWDCEKYFERYKNGAT